MSSTLDLGVHRAQTTTIRESSGIELLKAHVRDGNFKKTYVAGNIGRFFSLPKARNIYQLVLSRSRFCSSICFGSFS